MAEPEFSPEVRKALDSYHVPPLPAGFANRLLARIEASDTNAAVESKIPTSRLRHSSNTWRRSSRIIGSVAFLSLATATAAAAGIFGNPVYVPVVSEVLAKTELVPSPRYVGLAKSPAPIATPAKAIVEAAPVAPPTGTQAVVSKIEQLRADPNFENLTPRQKLAIAGKEVRTMVRSGEVTRPEARAAVRELVQSADPETKAQWKENAQARREVRLERRRQAEPVAATTADTDAVPVSDELPLVATDNIAPEQIEALRQRYRNATPTQRAEIRRDLRERRAARQQRRP